ncbi:hypothetical protein KV686_000651 [Salmonella enterica]|nr:hypothetical protein [Salmonella enterica subsp. enterica]EHS4586715.1 hypothetical protein [Salmonella enterica]EHS5051657.1 hypothetical protein [Salmonella enterica]
MEIKKSILVRKNIRLSGIIIDMLILTILLISTFDAVSDSSPVKASAINIALQGTPNTDYELNGDLRSNGGIMPKTLYMVCSGGKFKVSQADCVAGQWVDIEVVISADSHTFMNLTNMGNLSSSAFQEKRRARCTAKNSNTMDCIWESNFDINLFFSPSTNISSIERQSLTLHIEPTDNASPSLQQINISGDLIYQPSDYAVYNQGYTPDVLAYVNFYAKYNIVQSSFGTQTGPATGALPGRLNLNGNVATTVSLYPEQLDASFSKTEFSITSASKEFTGSGNNELLAEIYLNYGLQHCQSQTADSICGQILANANVSTSCGDHNITITTNMCNTGNGQCDGDKTWKIAEIFGTWGRVNVDTICAITVLLPYE